MAETKPVLLNLQQIARVLKISDDVTAKWLEKEMKKGLPAFKAGREWRLDSESLYGWIKTGGKGK